MIDLSLDSAPYRSAFLDMEYSAAAAYNEFVYRDRAQADTIRNFLFDKGTAEFSPPNSHLLVDDGDLAGFITVLSAEDLARCRMKSAFTIAKAGFFEEDPGLYERLRLATRVLVPLRKGDYYFSRLAVSPKHGRKGYAGLLMQHGQSIAARAGATRVAFETAIENIGALRLHAEQGFVEIGRAAVTNPDLSRTIENLHLAKQV